MRYAKSSDILKGAILHNENFFILLLRDILLPAISPLYNNARLSPVEFQSLPPLSPSD